jgi:hypothetical protein
MDSTNPRHSIFQGLVRRGFSGERAAELIEAWDVEARRRGVRPGPDYWRRAMEWIDQQGPATEAPLDSN